MKTVSCPSRITIHVAVDVPLLNMPSKETLGVLFQGLVKRVTLFACYSDCHGLQDESKCDLDAQWRKNGTESCKKCMSACQVAALTPCAARWH